MTLPPRSARVFVAMAVLTLVLASLARRDGAHDPRDARITLVILGAVLAFSTRSALLLLAARSGALPPTPDAARVHRLLPRTLLAVSAGAALGALVALAPAASSHVAASIALVGALAAFTAAAATRLEPPRPRRARPTSRVAFLVVDTALPSAVVAAAVGLVVGLVRLGGLERVTGESTARHLGGTVFLYAVFLGLGGFLKTYSEQSAGLVLVDKTTASVPGPVLTGGVLGVLLLAVGGVVLPDLGVRDVLVLKVAAGFFLGGLLSALGAVQGARAASLGLKRRARGG